MEIQRFKPPKTIEKFMLSNARRRVIMGPFGSGKSSGCCVEIPRRAAMQSPWKGQRKTRWAVIRNCFDDQTEILTELRGWVLFRDLREDDKVAMLDGDKTVFVAPTLRYAAPYKGEMLGCRSQNVDFLVTPDHNLWTTTINGRTKQRAPYKHEHASEAFGKTNRELRMTASWDGVDTGYSEDFFEFLGFWFAEGSAGVYPNGNSLAYRLVVTQKKNIDYARDLLRRAGIEFGESHKGDGNYDLVARVTPRVKELIRWMSICGHATTKKVPVWVKQAPAAHLAAFLNGFLRGDGHIKNGPREVTRMWTASKQLADDLQEIAFKAGFGAIVRLRDRTGEQKLPGSLVPAPYGKLYSVTLMAAARNHPSPRASSWYRQEYDGTVYCVEVPTHVVYVRRNGVPVWCGQTMPQLRDTTIKTWLKWFPNGTLGHWVENTRTYVIRQGDIYSEVLFRALDTPDDVAKLLSLELTGVYINECREIPKEIVDGLDGRINRYPSRDEGGADWSGIIADTNPPTEEEYWYYVIEGMDPDTQLPVADNGWESFIQPSGLSEQAENLENLPEGYYRDLAKNKSKEYIDVYIHGKYGKSKAGKPVHPTFDPHIHVARDILVPNPRLPILISADFGLTPAMTIKQQDVFGRVLTLDEIVTQEMGLKRAIAERLKPLLKRKYEGYNVRVTGDPAGNERAQTDEKSCVQIFKDAGFRRVKFARSNNPVHRIGATDSFLSRLTEQGPAYQIDPRCSFLKRGMAGGYHYPINRRGEVADGPKKNIFSHVCFVGSTEISTPHGRRRLEDIRVLDLVDTPLGLCRVTGLATREALVRLVLFSDGRVLEGTDDHPLFTRRGLVPLGDLSPDDMVITESGSDVWFDRAVGDFNGTVYTLGVEGAHCYFANGILVSNCESGQYGDMYFERLEESPDDDKDRRARVNDSHERARQQVYGRRD